MSLSINVNVNGSVLDIDISECREKSGPPMARKLRVEYPGAVYHVMNRGDRREPIFIDNEDRRLFLKRVTGR